MARPRKDDVQAAATTKIEAAFWQLLEKEDYSEITVRRISQKSGTNRNSFYYHYDDIEDLARTAFRNNTSESAGLISSLLATFHDNKAAPPLPDSSAISHAGRVMLCARSKSPFLKQMVSNLLQDAWFNIIDIDEKRLTPEERMQTRFIFSGLVAVLGSAEVKDSPLTMTSIASSKIGRAAISALEEIAAKQANNRN